MSREIFTSFISIHNTSNIFLLESSDHSWGALVQIRQKGTGGNTLLALEEKIIKSGLSSLTNSISATKDVTIINIYILSHQKFFQS